jgi:hypothetical protein
MENSEIEDYLKEAIISYYSGEITNDEAAVLLNWIGQSPDNLKHFQSIGEIWHVSGIIREHKYDHSKVFDKFRNRIENKGVDLSKNIRPAII